MLHFPFTFAVLVLVGLIMILLALKFVFRCTWLTFTCLLVLILIVGSIFGIHIIPLGPFNRVFVGPIVLLLAAICVIILIVQFFRWIVAGNGTAVSTAEKERILQMVEQGKISTEESTELLDALGRTNALRGQDKFSRLDIVMLCGVALVVLGFFLPWAYIRMDQIPGLFGQVTGYQAGYDVGALGWTIFIIALVSAIPVFVTPQNFLYKISMLQIFLTIIGTVLVISVLVRAGDDLGAGIVFCLLGFILGIVVSIAKLKKLAA